MNDKHVLILEDDPGLAQSLVREFEDHAYRAITASSYAKLEAERPEAPTFDYAVVDLRLKDGEFGLNAIEKIMARSPACRIVVLSGYGSITTAVEAVKKGATDYLTKPAGFAEIEAALMGRRRIAGSDLKTPSLSEVEHEHIDFVLAKNDGNISRTAKELGLHRQSLQRKLKKYS